MLRVEILENNDGWITSFIIEGHSGFSEYGKDIVCAGVSAITQTALLGLDHFLSNKKPKVEVGPGNLRCELPASLKKEERERAGVILETMFLGLKAVEENYAGNVKVIRRRCSI